METLDDLIAEHVADRLLRPERLEEISASAADYRQDRSERRREHIAELSQRVTATDLRLQRLHDATEASVTDVGNPALTERVVGLKAIGDRQEATPRVLPQRCKRHAGTKTGCNLTAACATIIRYARPNTGRQYGAPA